MSGIFFLLLVDISLSPSVARLGAKFRRPGIRLVWLTIAAPCYGRLRWDAARIDEKFMRFRGGFDDQFWAGYRRPFDRTTVRVPANVVAWDLGVL